MMTTTPPKTQATTTTALPRPKGTTPTPAVATPDDDDRDDKNEDKEKAKLLMSSKAAADDDDDNDGDSRNTDQSSSLPNHSPPKNKNNITHCTSPRSHTKQTQNKPHQPLFKHSHLRHLIITRNPNTHNPKIELNPNRNTHTLKPNTKSRESPNHCIHTF